MRDEMWFEHVLPMLAKGPSGMSSLAKLAEVGWAAHRVVHKTKTKGLRMVCVRVT